MSVLVMCPTRDRPRQLADLFRSMLGTSTKANLAAYVDHDQSDLYQWTKEDQPFSGRIRTTESVRIGPVAAANLLALRTEAQAYGFVPDDCTFTIAGWDEYVMEQIADSPHRICVVAPAVSSNGDVDMAFVSREWLEAVGWYALPSLYHWGWEAVIHSLAVATDTLVRAPEGKFWIEHDVLAPKNRDRYPADMVRLYEFFSGGFAPALDRLREALA